MQRMLWPGGVWYATVRQQQEQQLQRSRAGSPTPNMASSSPHVGPPCSSAQFTSTIQAGWPGQKGSAPNANPQRSAPLPLPADPAVAAAAAAAAAAGASPASIAAATKSAAAVAAAAAASRTPPAVLPRQHCGGGGSAAAPQKGGLQTQGMLQQQQQYEEKGAQGGGGPGPSQGPTPPLHADDYLRVLPPPDPKQALITPVGYEEQIDGMRCGKLACGKDFGNKL
eukprot:1158500-Pelagomonas_calceolata.AAC.5